MNIKKKEKEKKYFPMLAGFSVADMFDDENIQMWDNFHKLPQSIQDLLQSNEIVDFIVRVERRYHLQDEQTVKFSSVVRQYFFEDITEDVFINNVIKICNIKTPEALRLIQVLKSISPQKTVEENKIIYITLNEALKKYPKIANQVITNRSIVTKPFLKPLKPTIKNWIIVYEKILGVSIHDTIERGEFVFSSDATRGMTEEDRNNLLILLKSRDENTKLAIDLKLQKVVFDFEKKQTQKQNVKKQSMSVAKQPTIKQKIQEDIKQPTQQKEEKIKNLEISEEQKQQNLKEREEFYNQNQFNIEYIDYKVQSKNPQLYKVTHNVNDSQQEKQINTQIKKDNKKNTTLEQKTKEENIHDININSQKKQIDKIDTIQKEKQNTIANTQIIQQKKIKTTEKKEPEVIGISKELQKEITKNRDEMEVVQEQKIKDDKKEIGTEIYNIKNKKIISKSKPIKQRSIKSVGLPVQKQNTVVNTKPQKEINNKSNTKNNNTGGTISFSSNHVMPAERENML